MINNQIGQLFLLILFPFGMAGGQVLFKLTALEHDPKKVIFSLVFSWSFITAVILYGITTIGWVLMLKKINLSRAYPITAFSFVLVPILSRFIFGEGLSIKYFLGIVLIISGIVLTILK